MSRYFQFVSRREIGVSPFAAERMMPKAVPVEACHTQTGARGDHSLKAHTRDARPDRKRGHGMTSFVIRKDILCRRHVITTPA